MTKTSIRLLFGTIIGLLIIATTISLIQGKITFLFSLVTLVFIVMYFGGRLSAPIYLEDTIIKLLKENGGQMDYSKIAEYFNKSCCNKQVGIGDVVSIIIARLEKRKIIRVENNIVFLL